MYNFWKCLIKECFEGCISSLKKIGSKIGFSEIETKVLSFVFVSLFIGVGAYYLKYKDEIKVLKEYNYSIQDSLFNNSSNSKNDQKKVDYEQELYDFSDDELESVFTKININKASVKELVLLPGIGEKTAKKIIKFRKDNGKFKTKTDLLQVSGIGKKKLEKIKNLLIVE